MTVELEATDPAMTAREEMPDAADRAASVVPGDALSEAADRERGPLRRCIATRTVRPKAELVRFVLSREGELTPDLAGKLPGRGFWIGAGRAPLEAALKRQLFAKAAGRAVTVPPDLVERVARLARLRALDAIGLARRAGMAVSGHDKVEQWLRAGKAGVLLAAADGAADGRRKLADLAGDRPIVALFGADELAAAFGRDRVVHAAIAAGPLAEQFLAEAGRAAGFAAATQSDGSDRQ
ncbi:MAG: RNA-binding protein [Dongiaceae bacterium]